MPKRAVALTMLLWACCAAEPSTPPSDDPADYHVDSAESYQHVLSAPRWIIPGERLPKQAAPLAANNNVDIELSAAGTGKTRLFVAWRTAQSHFASAQARLVVMSSELFDVANWTIDSALSWRFEHEISLGADVREPRFVRSAGGLWLYFMQLGGNPLLFEPQKVWRVERRASSDWGAPVDVGFDGQMVWRIKRRSGRYLMTGYLGEHYGDGNLDVLFRTSEDGLSWRPVDPARTVSYRGGVSEVAFELASNGALWTVTRNEDGDATGFGSHVCTAPASALAAWQSATIRRCFCVMASGSI
jgi:hypothetical protein